MGDFWTTQCPARGPGLTHHTGKRWLNKCVECGLVDPPVVVKLVPPTEDELQLPDLRTDDDTLIEPSYIDPMRPRNPVGKEWDLSADEMARLAINCLVMEKKRGYR